MESSSEEEASPSSHCISHEVSTSRDCPCKQQRVDVNSMSKEGPQYLHQGLHLKPLQMVLAEALGTFIVVVGICGTSASAQGEAGLPVLLEYALAAGASVIVAVLSTAPISGAHINPANTIAFALFGHFPWSKVPFYVLGQVAGSALATLVGKAVYGLKPEAMLTVPYRGWAAAFWAEVLATFMVTFVAASMAKNEKAVGQLLGIVMGIAVMLAVLMTGPFSGGSLNPARSLGPAIVAWKFKHIWVYLVAPTVGSVLGVLMLHLLYLRNCPSPTKSEYHN